MLLINTDKTELAQPFADESCFPPNQKLNSCRKTQGAAQIHDVLANAYLDFPPMYLAAVGGRLNASLVCITPEHVCFFVFSLAKSRLETGVMVNFPILSDTIFMK